MLGFGAIGEFTLAQTQDVVIDTVIGPGPFVRNEIVLVEIFQYDLLGVTQVLRLSNVGYVGNVVGVMRLFDPRLFDLPMELAINLNIENLTSSMRSTTSISTIEFSLAGENYFTNTVYKHWVGAVILIKVGEINDIYDSFTLVYTGRVQDFNYDILSMKAAVKVVDFSIDFDKALVTDLYDEMELPPNRGRPKPYLRGQCYSIEPVLEDHVTQRYRISSGANLNLIMEVRVGGIVWPEDVTYPPAPGTWYGDLAGGIFYLGSETLGGEVRCDARADGWDEFTTARFLFNLANENSIENDLAQLEINAPELIGYYKALEPVNIMAVFDEVISSIGGWWGFKEGKILTAGTVKLAEPGEVVMSLSEVELNNFQLIKCIPPIYKLKVEYKRNWKPLTQAFSAVLDEDLDDMKASGTIATVFDNSGILVYESLAIDMVTIRSLVLTEDDALDIRGRFISAYSFITGTKIYDLEYYGGLVPELYDTIYVSVGELELGYFRVIGIVRTLPIVSGTTKLRVWGFN